MSSQEPIDLVKVKVIEQIEELEKASWVYLNLISQSKTLDKMLFSNIQNFRANLDRLKLKLKNPLQEESESDVEEEESDDELENEAVVDPVQELKALITRAKEIDLISVNKENSEAAVAFTKTLDNAEDISLTILNIIIGDICQARNLYVTNNSELFKEEQSLSKSQKKQIENAKRLQDLYAVKGKVEPSTLLEYIKSELHFIYFFDKDKSRNKPNSFSEKYSVALRKAASEVIQLLPTQTLSQEIISSKLTLEKEIELQLSGQEIKVNKYGIPYSEYKMKKDEVLYTLLLELQINPTEEVIKKTRDMLSGFLKILEAFTGGPESQDARPEALKEQSNIEQDSQISVTQEAIVASPNLQLLKLQVQNYYAICLNLINNEPAQAEIPLAHEYVKNHSEMFKKLDHNKEGFLKKLYEEIQYLQLVLSQLTDSHSKSSISEELKKIIESLPEVPNAPTTMPISPQNESGTLTTIPETPSISLTAKPQPLPISKEHLKLKKIIQTLSDSNDAYIEKYAKHGGVKKPTQREFRFSLLADTHNKLENAKSRKIELDDLLILFDNPKNSVELMDTMFRQYLHDYKNDEKHDHHIGGSLFKGEVGKMLALAEKELDLSFPKQNAKATKKNKKD